MIKTCFSLACLFLCLGRAWSQGACQAPAPLQFADEGGPHVALCSPLQFSHYPPTSGKHYPYWASPGAYDSVINAGNWLHAAEHGAVVFLINCHTAGDCHSDFAQLKKIADEYPHDPICNVKDNHRIIITGDTLITTRYAVVAWDWSLSSDCLDTAAFAVFLKAHYAHAPENICGFGTDFKDTVGFYGITWCNQPLAIATQRSTPAVARGERILWQGSLARRGRLTLEARTLRGEVLANYDLGPAGPGPASAKWDPKAIPSGFPAANGFSAAGAVVCRIGFSSASGSRVLAETIVRP